MTNFIRFRTVLLGAALIAVPAACDRDKTGKESENAAERVRANIEELREESREVVEVAKDRREDLTAKAADKAEDTIEDMNALKKERDADDVVDEAHDVAENARENRQDVREKAADNVEDVVAEHKDAAKEAMDVKHAQFDFGYARLTRVATLRAIHGVASAQPSLINAFAHDVELNDKERGLINEKLMIFQNRLDEAGNQIETLASVPAETWEQRHDDVNKAMDRLEDARDDAWDVLHASERAQARTSMR
jgi:hypothetical protein